MLEIHELPAARGCTYVLPAADFALGLAVGDEFAGSDMKQALTLGVTEKEVEALSAAVLTALGKGVMSPDEIRDATGSASRTLGEAGRKKGMTTTLPLALGRLQARGDIRRVPVNGRLDQLRYSYTRWTPTPRATFTLPLAAAYAELARRFFGWVGPATLGEFQRFAGLGVKAAKDVVAPLGLVPSDTGSDRLLLPADIDAFAAFTTPSTPQYSLVSSLDTITAARRDFKSMVDDKDLSRKVVSDNTLLFMGGLTDFPSHAILDRGRLIGL